MELYAARTDQTTVGGERNGARRGCPWFQRTVRDDWTRVTVAVWTERLWAEKLTFEEMKAIFLPAIFVLTIFLSKYIAEERVSNGRKFRDGMSHAPTPLLLRFRVLHKQNPHVVILLAKRQPGLLRDVRQHPLRIVIRLTLRSRSG